MNFRGARVKPKYIFFCIFECVDSINGENNLNESKRSMQVKAQLDKMAYPSRHRTDN